MSLHMLYIGAKYVDMSGMLYQLHYYVVLDALFVEKATVKDKSGYG